MVMARTRLVAGVTLEPWLEIATLKPVFLATENAFATDHNRSKRCIQATPSIYCDREETPSRASTPINDVQLAISFLEPPKNVTTGYILGSNDSCDIIIGAKNHRVSGHHLIITFDQEQNLLMRDISRMGSSVAYGEQPPTHRASPFTWVLPAGYTVTVNIAKCVEFTIEIPSRHGNEPRYRSEVQRFIKVREHALPSIETLDFATSVSTTGTATPRAPNVGRPAYVFDIQINKRNLGRVYKMYDASSWKSYAGKEVAGDRGEFEKEIAVLRGLSHDNIIKYIDVFHVDERKTLVMEFCALGSLDAEASRLSFNVTETSHMLKQVLSALAYIHPQGLQHRNIKPANILIRSREPLCIALVDFGLVKEQMVSFPGASRRARAYQAPDLYNDGDDDEDNDDGDNEQIADCTYWEMADVWSAGVVALEISFDLPKFLIRHYNVPKIINRRVTSLLNERPTDDFLKLLSQMLQLDPWERLTVQQCLKYLAENTQFESSPRCSPNDKPAGQDLVLTLRITSASATVPGHGTASSLDNKRPHSGQRCSQVSPRPEKRSRPTRVVEREDRSYVEQDLTETEVKLLLDS